MDENIRRQFIEAGIDIDDLMNRLVGNYSMIERFLKRFPTDESFHKLQKFLDEGDCEEAFRACHTLKGLCANLSMKELWKTVGEQVEFLRAGELVKAKNVMPKVSEMYYKMVEDIKKIYP